MNRTLMMGLAIAGLAVAFAIALFRREQPLTGVSPAAQYAIPQDQLQNVAAKANAGDCEAAGALADHYLNVALDLDAGLKWARRGATCPGTRPKVRLLVLLAQVPPSDATANEIHKLLDEVRQLDPAEADRMAASIAAEQRLLYNSGDDHSSH